MKYSPMAALNRAYAFSKVYGKEKAIQEALNLKLLGNLFYHSLLGELYTCLNNQQAIQHFQYALELAGSEQERAVLANKVSLVERLDYK
ncbi:MAG: hypothetical protein WKF89_02140 [Chitinophagaceae bacterium]